MSANTSVWRLGRKTFLRTKYSLPPNIKFGAQPIILYPHFSYKCNDQILLVHFQWIQTKAQKKVSKWLILLMVYHQNYLKPFLLWILCLVFNHKIWLNYSYRNRFLGQRTNKQDTCARQWPIYILRSNEIRTSIWIIQETRDC